MSSVTSHAPENLVGDEQRQRELRRMKGFATGLLAAAAVVFVVVRVVDDGQTWLGYVRACAEAAMVGALADWFAVTALFRHPLGIPIPHTAIIPRRKDQIGRSLGEFVQGNFLTREVLATRLAAAHVGARLGAWLADPEHAARAGEVVADAVRGTIEVLDDDDVREGVGRAVERRLRSTPVAPVLAKAIDVGIVEGDQQRRLLDAAMRGLSVFLEENRAMLRMRLDQESPWWVPEALDDRVFNKIFTGVQRFIADVQRDPDHEFRHAVDARIRTLAVRLREDPLLRSKVEDAKADLLAHRDVQAWLDSLWGELKAATLAATADPESELRHRLAGGLERAGHRLVADVELQGKIDDWVERLTFYLVEHYRGEAAELISTTVARWDSADTSRRIELQVGRDLQFIRINGTVVGGLAGLVIHAIGEHVI